MQIATHILLQIALIKTKTNAFVICEVFVRGKIYICFSQFTFQVCFLGRNNCGVILYALHTSASHHRQENNHKLIFLQRSQKRIPFLAVSVDNNKFCLLLFESAQPARQQQTRRLHLRTQGIVAIVLCQRRILFRLSAERVHLCHLMATGKFPRKA